MAPSSGHLLVPKALRIFRFAVGQITALPKRIPIHHLASLKQSRSIRTSRWISSFSKAPLHGSQPPKANRSKLPVSRTSLAIRQTGAAPFASTLRPNLTGGALPRSAGGYSVGGGARYFSHTSGCQAQVLQNVNAGIRAFFVNGGKTRFDGVDLVTGNKKWKAVGQAEDKAYRRWQECKDKVALHHYGRQSLGTSLDFHLSPTVTALLPVNPPSKNETSCLLYGSENVETTLQTPSVLSSLSSDFARALHDLALITHDLELLSRFGALPILLHQSTLNTGNTKTNGPVLRVRFPGCDGDTVSALCDEVGVKRGIIHEDEEWSAERNKQVQMALLFSLAPSSPLSTNDCIGYGNQWGQDSVYGDDSEDGYPGRGYFLPRQASISQELHRESSILTATTSESLYSASHVSTGTLSPPHEGLSSSDSGVPLFTFSSDFCSISLPLPSPSQPQSPVSSDLGSEFTTNGDGDADGTSTEQRQDDYEGVEGIYRFLQECDEAAAASARRRVR